MAPPRCAAASPLLHVGEAEHASAPCAFAFAPPLFDPPVHSLRPLASCAVVSSSGILNSSGCGKAVDAHSAIFRMNLARTRGHERDVGGRTTIQLLNSHNARRLRHSSRERAAACSSPASLLLFGDEWLPDDNETRLEAQLNAMRGCRISHSQFGLQVMPGKEVVWSSFSSTATARRSRDRPTALRRA